jgi:hypothetical protein
MEARTTPMSNWIYDWSGRRCLVRSALLFLPIESYSRKCGIGPISRQAGWGSPLSLLWFQNDNKTRDEPRKVCIGREQSSFQFRKWL